MGEVQPACLNLSDRFLRGSERRRANGLSADLSFVCIDPAYQGRGAGKLLSKSVLDLAEKDGLPVYLESTDVAVRMYEKLRFRRVDKFEMMVPSRGGTGEEIYEEVCMIWEP